MLIPRRAGEYLAIDGMFLLTGVLGFCIIYSADHFSKMDLILVVTSGYLVFSGTGGLLRWAQKRDAEDEKKWREGVEESPDDPNVIRVQQYFPEASCFQTKMYWPGQGQRRMYVVTQSPLLSRSFAIGETKEEAWKHAADRVDALEMYVKDCLTGEGQ